jgi:hypothetical protein
VIDPELPQRQFFVRRLSVLPKEAPFAGLLHEIVKRPPTFIYEECERTVEKL